MYVKNEYESITQNFSFRKTEVHKILDREVKIKNK
jgi:hypothetical protein